MIIRSFLVWFSLVLLVSALFTASSALAASATLDVIPPDAFDLSLEKSGSCPGTEDCLVVMEVDRNIPSALTIDEIFGTTRYDLLLLPIYSLLLKGDDGNIGKFDCSIFSTQYTFGE